MVPLPPASFALRHWRRIALLVPALIVAATLGCGHRRTSMRPVYTTTPSTTCPSTGTTTTTSPVTSEPTLTSPTTISEPTTSIPLLDKSTTPAATNSSRPSVPDEPPLELTPVPKSNSSSVTPPSVQGPKGASSLKSSDRRGAQGPPRQTALRSRIQPLVDDPADLFLPPRADRPWKYVVLHHSASASGSYDQIDHEHRETLGWQGCGYHFVIGNGTDSPDGRVQVTRRWAEQKQGIHCRDGKNSDVSEYGIGICLVGDLDKAPPTAKQVASAQALVAYLSDRYQVPTARVETHQHLASAPTGCPGKHFPTQAILGPGKLAR